MPVWTVGAMALHVVAARLAATRIGATLRASSSGRIALEGAQFFFFVGLPYAALLTGAFVPRDVGLVGSPDPGLILGWPPETWARAIGQAVALGVATLAAAAFLIGQIRRARGYPLSALGIHHGTAARAIRDALYSEIHWSFYRALPMMVFGQAHWAALGGLALAAAEAILSGGRTSADAARITPFESLLAALSAAFFALTDGNVWVAATLQIAVRVGVTRLASAGDLAQSRDDIIV